MKIKAIRKITYTSSKKYYDVINANPYNNFLVKTNSTYIVSHNCFEDEVSFQPNQDVEKQKKKATELVNTVTTRMQSRFMRGTVNPTIFVLASSKRTEQSFMETFIENKKKNESKTTWVVDEPQWVIRTDKDSERKFKVAIGNKFLNSEVLPLEVTEQELKLYRDRGFTILDVPIGYYENFIDDIDIALTDIAGISTSNVTRYIAGNRVADIKKPNLQNLFTKDIIEVGNGADDTTQYYDFIDMERLDPIMHSRPMYIHLDMSISGDKTGIAGVWIKGKKPTKEGEPPSKDLYYQLAFSVSVKAPKGHQISFEKNRQFIRWLREKGFSIRGISSDTFQSADLLQQLAAENFKTEIISVDRVKDNICIPYQVLKSAIYEKRLDMYEAPLLTEELIGLERNNNGKVDHGPSGINCFTGDTKVRLVDGRSLTMLELIDEFNNGKVNYVYTFNELTKKIEPKPIVNAFKSGENAHLVEVTLDDGSVIHCTPEHRFMKRDGAYCQAKDLQTNDLLMPLDTKYIINHKVISVKYIDQTEDVYDLTIEGNHNFALDVGIIVHNSKDQADGLCGALYNASQHAEEFAFEYGEDLTTAVDVSSSESSVEQVRQQITIDFQEELDKMFDPMRTIVEQNTKNDEKQFLNFGMGRATNNFDSVYISNGIII